MTVESQVVGSVAVAAQMRALMVVGEVPETWSLMFTTVPAVYVSPGTVVVESTVEPCLITSATTPVGFTHASAE
jgi:hypothetical protein